MTRLVRVLIAAIALVAIPATAHAQGSPDPTPSDRAPISFTTHQQVAATSTSGPTLSDRPPVLRSTHQQARPTSPGFGTQATVDAANTYTTRHFIIPQTGRPYYNATATAVIEHAGTPGMSGYFYANSWWFDGGSDFGGYIGLQTRLFNPVPGGGCCVDAGRGAIFSIWGATAGSAASGGTVVTGSELGAEFLSVHLPYSWVVGHSYSYAVSREKSGNTLMPKVNAWMIDLTTGVQTPIGTLVVPSGWGGIEPTTVEWIEEYTPSAYGSCFDIPPAQALFTGRTYLVPTYPLSTFRYAISNDSSIQAGTGCTNSNVITMSADQSWTFRHKVGTV